MPPRQKALPQSIRRKDIQKLERKAYTLVVLSLKAQEVSNIDTDLFLTDVRKFLNITDEMHREALQSLRGEIVDVFYRKFRAGESDDENAPLSTQTPTSRKRAAPYADGSEKKRARNGHAAIEDDFGSEPDLSRVQDDPDELERMKRRMTEEAQRLQRELSKLEAD